MRLVTFRTEAGGVHVGLLQGEGALAQVKALLDRKERPVRDLAAWLADPEVAGEPLEALRERLRIAARHKESGESHLASKVRLLAPVPLPPKVTCIGANYRGLSPKGSRAGAPLVFAKARTSVCGPTDAIVLGPGEERVEVEVELAVVIGRAGYRIPRERARDHILGYTVACDVSDRGAQMADGQFYRGKSRPTYCPTGPAIRLEGTIDPDNLRLTSRIFDEPERTPGLLQDGATSDMISGVDALVAAVSASIPLEAGELILTGTPPHIGVASPGGLAPGQRVVCEIDGIGALSCPVERAPL